MLYRTFTEELSAIAHRGRRGRFRCRRSKNRFAGEKPLIEIVWVLDHNPNLFAKIGQGCAEENQRDKKQKPDASLVRQSRNAEINATNMSSRVDNALRTAQNNSAVNQFGARIQAGYVGNFDKIG